MVRLVVAAGQDAGTRRGAQCGGVHVVVEQTVRCQTVQVRGLDRTTVATQLTETSVVQDDKQNVWGTLPGA